jgi:hypothetical protein
MPVDPTTSKGTRVKATTLKDGKKVRAASKTGEQLDK